MNLLKEWGDRIDRLEPAAKRLGHRADKHACTVIDLLTDIRTGVQNLYPDANAYDYQRLPVAAGAIKTIDGRQGYSKVLENISVEAAAAVDVDLYVLTSDSSGFVRRFSLTAAGKNGWEIKIPVPEGQAYYVQASIAAQVNVIARRTQV